MYSPYFNIMLPNFFLCSVCMCQDLLIQQFLQFSIHDMIWSWPLKFCFIKLLSEKLEHLTIILRSKIELLTFHVQ